MKKISNDTEIVIVFERIDEPETATTFYPVKAVTGYPDKKRKVFVASDGREYKHLVTTKDKYSFGMRTKVGTINKFYQKRTLNSLLKAHYKVASKYFYYFGIDKNISEEVIFICEDEKGTRFLVDDKDFESFKKYHHSDNKKNTIEVNTKELITEVKKKIIGQDDAVEDIVSIIWQNSKSKRKQNTLIIGPTGVGKTEIIRVIAKKLNIPIAIENAAGMTQSGYVGKSVDDVLRELVMSHGKEAAENAIIVIDEIDKIATKEYTSNDIATVGVQDELLKLLEDGTYTIDISKDALSEEIVTINTKNITFIALGAFSELMKEKKENKSVKKIGFGQNNSSSTNIANSRITTEDLEKYGLKPELIGRFSNIIELKSLTKENLIQIMKNPHEELIQEKIKILSQLGVHVVIEENVYEKLAEVAIQKNTGARGLISAVDDLFKKAMTEISQKGNLPLTLVINKETISDPKKYILKKTPSSNN